MFKMVCLFSNTNKLKALMSSWCPQEILVIPIYTSKINIEKKENEINYATLFSSIAWTATAMLAEAIRER